VLVPPAAKYAPLRGHKIGRILERGFDASVIAVYRGGAADAQGVGPRALRISSFHQCISVFLRSYVLYFLCEALRFIPHCNRVEVIGVPSRTAILRLYDYLATQIRLDFTTATPHIFGCTGTLDHTFSWLATAQPTQQDEWQAWLSAMCIDCDCAMLLQLNTLAVENGALEGINMRRWVVVERRMSWYTGWSVSDGKGLTPWKRPSRSAASAGMQP
jgi:hypothetical protein